MCISHYYSKQKAVCISYYHYNDTRRSDLLIICSRETPCETAGICDDVWTEFKDFVTIVGFGNSKPFRDIQSFLGPFWESEIIRIGFLDGFFVSYLIQLLPTPPPKRFFSSL